MIEPDLHRRDSNHVQRVDKDDLTCINIERDTRYHFDNPVVARKQVAESTAQTLAAIEDLKVFAQVFTEILS